MIRLPNDYGYTEKLVYNKNRRTIEKVVTLPEGLPASLAVAAGVASVVIKNPVVSRRFWSR